MSIKAVGIAIKLTVYVCFVFWQALDTFNAAIVSPIYYVMFTTLTIVASVIMFKAVDCDLYSCLSHKR